MRRANDLDSAVVGRDGKTHSFQLVRFGTIDVELSGSKKKGREEREQDSVCAWEEEGRSEEWNTHLIISKDVLLDDIDI